MALQVTSQTVTTAGTRVQLAASGSAMWLSIQAAPGNTNKIYVGDASVSSTDYGVFLSPGDSLMIPGIPGMGVASVNLADIYLDADTNGNKVFLMYNI